MGLFNGIAKRQADSALRRRHNDFDYACIYWYGDRNPDPRDLMNREMSGEATTLRLRRCPVCHPYTEQEAQEVLDALNPFKELELQ